MNALTYNAFADNREAIAIHVDICNEFFLPSGTVARLQSHYILHWDKDYLLNKLTPNGTLIHADKEYIPIKRCNLNNPDIYRVRLSFREPKSDLNIPSYVLIKAA